MLHTNGVLSSGPVQIQCRIETDIKSGTSIEGGTGALPEFLSGSFLQPTARPGSLLPLYSAYASTETPEEGRRFPPTDPVPRRRPPTLRMQTNAPVNRFVIGVGLTSLLSKKACPKSTALNDPLSPPATGLRQSIHGQQSSGNRFRKFPNG